MLNANSIRLRACRKRSGLDQAELATLVGRNIHSFASFERGQLLPDTQSLIAYEIIFNAPAANILPDTKASVRRDCYLRAKRLLKRCNASPLKHKRYKVEFLDALCRRLDGSDV